MFHAEFHNWNTWWCLEASLSLAWSLVAWVFTLSCSMLLLPSYRHWLHLVLALQRTAILNRQLGYASNSKVSTYNAITVESILESPITQKALSAKIEEHLFQSLLFSSSLASKARLLSVSAPHAASHRTQWVSRTIRWWLVWTPPTGPCALSVLLFPLIHLVTMQWCADMEKTSSYATQWCAGMGETSS